MTHQEPDLFSDNQGSGEEGNNQLFNRLDDGYLDRKNTKAFNTSWIKILSILLFSISSYLLYANIIQIQESLVNKLGYSPHDLWIVVSIAFLLIDLVFVIGTYLFWKQKRLGWMAIASSCVFAIFYFLESFRIYYSIVGEYIFGLYDLHKYVQPVLAICILSVLFKLEFRKFYTIRKIDILLVIILPAVILSILQWIKGFIS